MVKKKKKLLAFVGVAALTYFLYKKMKAPSGSTGSQSNASGSGAYDQQKSNNLRLLNSAMKDAGIRNQFARTAIMAVVGKESNFIPKFEKCYNNTSNYRIKKIFPSRLGTLTDSQLNALKADCVAFFNKVYGGKYGNAENEGYKYRGSGYNQLTFKASYKKIGDLIGVDLVSNPDYNNNPVIAAKSMVAFMLDRANSETGKAKLRAGGFNSINDINNIDFAVRYFANANAGFGNGWTSDKVNNAVARSMPYVQNVSFYSF